MAGDDVPSFGRMVFGKAISDTWTFFGSTKRDVVLAVISLAVGFGLYWHFKGLPDAMSEAASVLAFTFAPVGFVVVAVFLWNLWLAPAALAYEAAKASIGQTANSSASQAINWSPWKHRAHYTLYEFAKILSKTDPASQRMSTEGSAFARLLQEDIGATKLKYVPRYRVGEFNGRRYEVAVDYETEISRDDAIAWAHSKKFPVDHVK